MNKKNFRTYRKIAICLCSLQAAASFQQVNAGAELSTAMGIVNVVDGVSRVLRGPVRDVGDWHREGQREAWAHERRLQEDRLATQRYHARLAGGIGVSGVAAYTLKTWLKHRPH